MLIKENGIEHYRLKRNTNLIKSGLKNVIEFLKDNGTIWISGTLHNIYSIGMALEENGFKIINNITWQKQILHQIYLVKHLHIRLKLFFGQEKI